MPSLNSPLLYTFTWFIQSFNKKILSFFSANQDWAAQEQNLRIFNLQLERERLKRRQQEIAKLNVSFSTFFWGYLN